MRRVTGMVAGFAATLAMFGAAGEASAADKLTIKPRFDQIVFSARNSIKGKLRTDQGASPGGHEVRLFATAYPSKKAEVLATTTTQPNGNYAFKRLPSRSNTKYQAVVSDDTVSARSKRIDVYAFPTFRLSFRTKGTTSYPTMRINYPAELKKVPQATGVFYFRKTSENTYRRKDIAKARPAGPGSQIAKGKVKLPDPGTEGYEYKIVACLQFPDKKFGLFPPSNKGKCPATLPKNGQLRSAPFSSVSASPLLPSS